MNRKRILLYILFDVLAAMIVWFLYFSYRRVANDFVLFPDRIPSFIVPSYGLLLSFIAFPVVAVSMHYLTGYYNLYVKRSRLLEFFDTVISSFFASVVIFFAMVVDDIVVDYSFYYSSFFILWGLFFVVTYLFRIVQTSIYISRLHNGRDVENILIVGVGDIAADAAESLKNKACKKGYRIAGFLEVKKVCTDKNKVVLGNIDDLERVVEEFSIKSVVVAVDDMDNDFIFSIVNRLIRYNIDVCLVPRLFEIVIGRTDIADIDSEPFVSVSRCTMPAWQQSVKRVFDVVSSLLALIILMPLMLVIAVVIKQSSKGPVFFKQERIGYHGKPFMIYKFRTMYQNAEMSGPQLSVVGDNRITKCGSFLRRYRLDEIPQFFNIIKGDMSVVGPRPERRFFIKEIEKKAPYYCLIYKVRPGLLSWGPIKIGYSDTVDKMVRRLKYDIVYMDNMSLYLDMKIIAYSLEIIVKGKGQ